VCRAGSKNSERVSDSYNHRKAVAGALKELAGAAAEAEQQAIRRALEITMGNKSEAARLQKPYCHARGGDLPGII